MMNGYVVGVPMLMKVGPERKECLFGDVIVGIYVNNWSLLGGLVGSMNLLDPDPARDSMMAAL